MNAGSPLGRCSRCGVELDYNDCDTVHDSYPREPPNGTESSEHPSPSTPLLCPRCKYLEPSGPTYTSPSASSGSSTALQAFSSTPTTPTSQGDFGFGGSQHQGYEEGGSFGCQEGFGSPCGKQLILAQRPEQYSTLHENQWSRHPEPYNQPVPTHSSHTNSYLYLSTSPMTLNNPEDDSDWGLREPRDRYTACADCTESWSSVQQDEHTLYDNSNVQSPSSYEGHHSTCFWPYYESEQNLALGEE